MRHVGPSRRRRVLVAACLPYLLLSLFVDLVHLHPLLNGGPAQISTSQHIGKCSETPPKAPEAPCAICQWLRADTAVKASLPVGPMIVRLPDVIALSVPAPRGS